MNCYWHCNIVPGIGIAESEHPTKNSLNEGVSTFNYENQNNKWYQFGYSKNDLYALQCILLCHSPNIGKWANPNIAELNTIPTAGSNMDAKNWYKNPRKKSSSEILALQETRKAVPAAGRTSELRPSNLKVKNCKCKNDISRSYFVCEIILFSYSYVK